MAKQPVKNAAAALHARSLALLADHDEAAQRDPMAASVRRLAIDLLEQREAGRVGEADLRALVKQVADSALAARAGRLGASKPKGDWRAVVDAAMAPLKGAPLAAVKAALEAPRAGVVFTAHPPFALSRAMRTAIGVMAGGAESDLAPLAHLPDHPITLAYEHEDASAALAQARAALDGFHDALFVWLEANVEGAWWTIAPAPVRLATWVGYDLDGRTDIHWAQTIRFRLMEKAAQLSRYARLLAPLGERAAALGERLRRAG